MASNQNNGCHGGKATPPSGTFLFRDNDAHFHIIGAITDVAATIEKIGQKPLPAGLFTTTLSKSKR